MQRLILTATWVFIIINSNAQNVGIGTASPAFKLDVTGSINTVTDYRIGSSRVFSIGGTANLFAGVLAGNSNTSGSYNAFFGNSSGLSNSAGVSNSFFGAGS